MPIPHDVFKHILSFYDPRYLLVRLGIPTNSAQCMPLEEGTLVNGEVPWTGNTLFICNQGALEHHGTGQHVPRPFNPNRTTGGHARQIDIYSLCGDVDIVFDTTRCCLPDNLVRPPSDLWWQCEPCGPDMTLYGRLWASVLCVGNPKQKSQSSHS